MKGPETNPKVATFDASSKLLRGNTGDPKKAGGGTIGLTINPPKT